MEAPVDTSEFDLIRFTGREKQVIDLLVKGLLYKQIAMSLDISIKTVEFHVSKVYKKLEVSDRFDLTIQILHKRTHEPSDN